MQIVKIWKTQSMSCFFNFNTLEYSSSVLDAKTMASTNMLSIDFGSKTLVEAPIKCTCENNQLLFLNAPIVISNLNKMYLF